MDNVVEENVFQLQAVEYNELIVADHLWSTACAVSNAEHFVHCDSNGIWLFTVIYIQIKYLFPDSIRYLKGEKNHSAWYMCVCVSHCKGLKSYPFVV